MNGHGWFRNFRQFHPMRTDKRTVSISICGHHKNEIYNITANEDLDNYKNITVLYTETNEGSKYLSIEKTAKKEQLNPHAAEFYPWEDQASQQEKTNFYNRYFANKVKEANNSNNPIAADNDDSSKKKFDCKEYDFEETSDSVDFFKDYNEAKLKSKLH